MLSPALSIPARPALPIICLYCALFRKSLATYGDRKITLQKVNQSYDIFKIYTHIKTMLLQFTWHAINAMMCIVIAVSGN